MLQCTVEVEFPMHCTPASTVFLLSLAAHILQSNQRRKSCKGASLATVEHVHVEVCISTSAHGAFSYEMEQGLLGCGGSNVPSGGKVLRKPFTRLQQEGLLLALACRCCPASKVCPAVPALPGTYLGGWALPFWLLACCSQSHTRAARCLPSHAPWNSCCRSGPWPGS